MQFVYLEDCGKEVVEIRGEQYNHIFKARRKKANDIIKCRNLKDKNLYSYAITSIDRRMAILKMLDSISLEVKPKRELELFWCGVESKTIEKTIPILNEIGVSKLSILMCQRSQKNIIYDLDRLKRIAIRSCEQCGRSDLIEIEVEKRCLKELLNNHNDIVVVDFEGENRVELLKENSRFLIGCEGGFSDEERELFSGHKRYKFGSEIILRSESAAVATLSMAMF